MYTGIKYALLYATSDHFHSGREPCDVCILHYKLSQAKLKYIYIHKYNRNILLKCWGNIYNNNKARLKKP